MTRQPGNWATSALGLKLKLAALIFYQQAGKGILRHSRETCVNPCAIAIAQVQSRSSVGHRCCFWSSFAVLSQALAFLAGDHWWVSSNCRPIAEFGGETSVCRFQPLPAIRFGKHFLALHKRNQHSGLQRELLLEPVRRRHATSKLIIKLLPFRRPIAGLSPSCRCS